MTNSLEPRSPRTGPEFFSGISSDDHALAIEIRRREDVGRRSAVIAHQHPTPPQTSGRRRLSSRRRGRDGQAMQMGFAIDNRPVAIQIERATPRPLLGSRKTPFIAERSRDYTIVAQARRRHCAAALTATEDYSRAQTSPATTSGDSRTAGDQPGSFVIDARIPDASSRA